MIQRGFLNRLKVAIVAHGVFLSIVLFYGIVLDFPCLLAEFRPGIKLQVVFELCLTSRATQKVVHAINLNDHVRLVAIHAFAADGVFE